MRAIIAEDEQIAREAILSMAGHCNLEVLAECRDGAELMRQLQASRPDLLFLDVQMPGIDGFGVLQGIPKEKLPAIIFTTAYGEYAVQAFEHNAVDYLLKPFNEERFRKAVDRARLTIAQRSGAAQPERGDVGQPPSHTTPQRLVVRSKGTVEIVRVDDIDWIAAQHNYVQLHAGNVVHTLRQTIQEIESRLDADSFLRIHRSIIVNVDRIRCLQACGYGEYLVVLKSGKSLPLSRSYRERLDHFLERVGASTQPKRINGVSS